MTIPSPGSIGWIIALCVFLVVIILSVVGHLAPLLALLIGGCALSRLL